MHDALVRVDPVQVVSNPACPRVERDPLQRIAANAWKREWLAHRKRPVDEFLLGAEQRHLDAVAGEPPHAQEAFDSGDPATADQYFETGYRFHAPCRRLERKPESAIRIICVAASGPETPREPGSWQSARRERL